MGRNVPKTARTTPAGSLVIPRPTPAKATLKDDTDRQDVTVTTPTTDNVGQLERTNRRSKLSTAVSDAARSVYGKQGVAAEILRKDEGNFARDLRAGRVTLAQLESLGDGFLAEFGKGLVEQYGPLLTPKDRMLRYIDEVERVLAELKSLIHERVA